MIKKYFSYAVKFDAANPERPAGLQENQRMTKRSQSKNNELCLFPLLNCTNCSVTDELISLPVSYYAL